MNKRKTTEQQKTTKDSLQEIEALLEIGVPPHRPPKKVQPEKTQPPKKTVKKTTKKVIKKIGEKKQDSWDSMTYLLTFPQWEGDETLEDLLELLCEFWKEKDREVLEAIICIENHGPKATDKGHETGEDPGRHIHTCFKLNKKMKIRRPDFFDNLFGEKHGDIQTCRDYRACQIYCNKDGNVITKNVDIDAVVESTRTKKGVKHETVANFCRKKPRTIFEVDQKFPGYTIQHLSKIKDYLILQDARRSSELQPYYGIDQAKTMMLGRDNPPLIQLVSWLNENLNKPREYRQKQLWLHGKSGVGKSTLLSDISQYFNAYQVANEEKWWSGIDSTKQIIVFDEYTGYKTISDMKRLLDGSEFPMPQKYATLPFLKKRKSMNIPIIICSNSTPEQIYHKVKEEKPQEFEPLLERITVIELTVKGTQVPWNKAPPVLDESPDEEEQDTPEPPHRPGTPPITERVLKRGKPLRTRQEILESLQCSEEMEDSKSEELEPAQVPDPYEIDEQEDPYNPEDHSQYSQEEKVKKAKKLYSKLNK